MSATVNISGTWSEKQKPLNGLTTHADTIHKDRTLRVPVVAFVEYHQWTEKLTGDVLTVSIGAIEPATEADGTDPSGVGKQVMDLLDQLRKQRGKGSVDEVPSHSGELAGQVPFDFDGGGEGAGGTLGEVRLGPDGPREVPPPSAEEELAERAEKKEREGLSADKPGPSTPGGVKAKDRAKPTSTPFAPGGGDAA